MNKADMVRKIHETAGIDEELAASVLESVLELLKAGLKTGEAINIIGFGKFSVLQKQARQGRNPRTGQAVTICARRAISFHASPAFKNYVNGDVPLHEPSLHERTTIEARASAIEGP
jgi:nucleoid DNA-binding protein